MKHFIKIKYCCASVIHLHKMYFWSQSGNVKLFRGSGALLINHLVWFYSTETAVLTAYRKITLEHSDFTKCICSTLSICHKLILFYFIYSLKAASNTHTQEKRFGFHAHLLQQNGTDLLWGNFIFNLDGSISCNNFIFRKILNSD